MDEKAFELFEQSIQWVADEDRRARRDEGGEKTLPWSHSQMLWASGRVSADRVDVTAPREARGPLSLRRSQTMWVVCPTACCVAGNIVALHGDQMVTNAGPKRGDHGTRSAEWCVDSENTLHTISERAADLVGINSVEARQLFDGANSRSTVVEVAKDIAQRHGRTLNIK